MKRIALLLFMLCLFSKSMPAQSNTVTVTVVAPPTWTITAAPMNYYQNAAKTMTITVTAGVVVNTCTATWDTTNLPLSFPVSLVNPVAITAQVTAAMTATQGSHSIVLSCPVPVLSMMDPVTLPNGKAGSTYSAAIAPMTGISGGVPPYTWSLTGGSLPIGVSLSSSGVVTGTPSGAGTFNFTYLVKDSSGMGFRRENDNGLRAGLIRPMWPII